MNTELMFSSKDQTWSTPQDFFNKLDEEFGFTLDPCASPQTAKCAKYFTEADDGLSKDWSGEVVFCNPPYGRALPAWVKKCREEGSKASTTVVMLIPSRTDTKYFHEHIWHGVASEVRFLKGRLKFGGCKDAAPFPSLVAVYRGDK